MIEGILQGLLQWIYGLFLDLMSYCANALLGVMSTDLSFFETSVPIVPSLYQIFVAVGWGLLIGNMAFQAMKAMFAGLGIESESPYILMLRTFLFGILLIFSKDICDIGLSISKNVIELLGIPDSVTLTLPNEAYFGGSASWLLVIIIGFILGFQLIKLFFEIAERYVVVAVLTLLMPVGLAMGGSKSTKNICSGYIRMYASTLVLMVSNILFLKLILSALAAMPTGAMVLPWCLLIVGIAKTARKTDDIITRIGMNPAMTGDPLGSGRGMMMVLMAARTIMAARGRGSSAVGNGTTNQQSNSNATHSYSNNSYNKNGGTNVGGNSVYNGGTNNTGTNNGGTNNSAVNNGKVNNSNNVNNGGVRNNSFNNGSINTGNNYQSAYSTGGTNISNINSNSSPRFGSANYTNFHKSERGFSTVGVGGADTGRKINTNRFGIQKDIQNTSAPAGTVADSSKSKGGINQKIQKSETKVNMGMNLNRKERFGSTNSGGIKHNKNPMKQVGKTDLPKTNPSKTPSMKTQGGVKTPNVKNGKGISPDNVRFGSLKYRKFRDDDILISREDDSDV